MSHLLTGIPLRSRVIVYANGRFPQADISSQTGAIRIRATDIAYPLRVAIRPASAAPSGPPGVNKNFGPLGPDGYTGTRHATTGPEIDFMIRDADERREAGSEPYLHVRRPRGEAICDQVQAPSSPETDIYQQVFCSEGCGAAVPSYGPCPSCRPQERLCTAARMTGLGAMECRQPSAPGFDVCEAHAREKGLIKDDPKPVAAASEKPRDVCAYGTCDLPRYVKTPFCYGHAEREGLLDVSTVTVPDVPEPKRRQRRSHRDGCKCVACKYRRRREERLTESGAQA